MEQALRLEHHRSADAHGLMMLTCRKTGSAVLPEVSETVYLRHHDAHHKAAERSSIIIINHE
jgi:hypothetical protein